MIRGNYPPGYMGWELLDAFVFSKDQLVSEITFNGLNGELDNEYLLRFDIRLADSTKRNGLICTINGLRGEKAGAGRYIHLSGNNGKGGCNMEAKLQLGIPLGGYQSDHGHRYMRGELFIEANSRYGLRRVFNTDYTFGFIIIYV